jgi:hypothetical protein
VRKGGKCRIDLPDRSGIESLDLQPDSEGSPLHVPQCSFSNRSIGRVEEHGNTHGLGHQLTQMLFVTDGGEPYAVLKPFKLTAAGWVSSGKGTPLAVTPLRAVSYGGSITLATLNAASATYHRSVIGSALANGIGCETNLRALRSLGFNV